jgi:hypothetical protein
MSSLSLYALYQGAQLITGEKVTTLIFLASHHGNVESLKGLKDCSLFAVSEIDGHDFLPSFPGRVW